MEYSIVGYGSLISHRSLKETIKDKRLRLVIVKGYKRIFNISTGPDKDLLNLEKSPESKFNGVMFKVNDEELEKIREREDVYEFEETEVYDFKSGRKIGKAFVVIDYFRDMDYKNNLPSKSYFILCREAAYHISKKFGEYWDNTTYTLDNEKISKWIKKHKDYNSLRGIKKKM